MVLDKIRNVLNPTSDKYEVLYHKYSKLKLDNKNLREKHQGHMDDLEHEVKLNTARNLIKLYEKIEETKQNSHKVKIVNPDVQNMMMGVVQMEKLMRGVMHDLELQPISAENKFYDDSECEIASYTPANGLAQNLILKTVKKGFRFRGKLIKKPRVVVTR